MTIRDEDARRACRTLGGQANSYVTGDPGPDDVAEYFAAAWLLMDDYYREEEDPPYDVGGSLIRTLHSYGQAFIRLAGDLQAGRTPLDELRRTELPR